MRVCLRGCVLYNSGVLHLRPRIEEVAERGWVESIIRSTPKNKYRALNGEERLDY